jgi:hypothetical protein
MDSALINISMKGTVMDDLYETLLSLAWQMDK